MKNVLQNSRTVAIVGLSPKPGRTSHRIGRYLRDEAGYTIIPVNPRVDEVLGARSWPSVRDIPAQHTIDIVNVFRRPEYLPDIARDTVARSAGFFWAQLGIDNDEAAGILASADIPYVMDRCIFVEHQHISFR